MIIPTDDPASKGVQRISVTLHLATRDRGLSEQASANFSHDTGSEFSAAPP